MKRALLVVVLLLLAFVGVTGWALESGGVAVVETRRPDGSTRSTQVWYGTSKGEPPLGDPWEGRLPLGDAVRDRHYRRAVHTTCRNRAHRKKDCAVTAEPGRSPQCNRCTASRALALRFSASLPPQRGKGSRMGKANGTADPRRGATEQA